MPKKSRKTNTTADGTDLKRPSDAVVFWLQEIQAAKKREKEFRKDGQKVLDIYDGRAKNTPFNILFSNTETLLSAFYSMTPRPVVQRRFKDNDPIGKAAAMAGQRALEFLLDTNTEGYETFDEAMQAVTLDGLLPGRGSVCVKYDAQVGQMAMPEPPALETETARVDEEAPLAEPATTPYKESELICLDHRSWDRWYHGYAKKWSKVPWIAYEEHIDQEEAARLFGEERARTLVYTTENSEDRERDDKTEDEKNKGERKTVCVYQIWDKDGDGTLDSKRKLRYVTEQYQDDFLAVLDDPLGLTGFFNCPRPIQFISKSNDLRPTALYMIYENQAAELNRLTKRINKIVDAIKARGVYDSELGDDIKKLFTADDNELVPADKSSSLAAEKGLQNAIWFAPIEQLVNVLIQLYGAREQCKRVIYEITGISDIIRGSTVASETATAQNIKSQWGTLRLKRPQKEVQRYTRDLLRMMLEIAATKFSEETWAKMTGLPFTTTAERQELEALAAAAAQTGQSPDQATQAKLVQPPWGQVIETLRNDMQRAYRIDIETNSTIEPEAAEDQKHISELMTAMGQYLNGVGPLVAKGIMPFGAAQAMLLAIARRFRFGGEVEDFIKQMQPPKMDGEDDKATKQAELQQKQQEGQLKIQEMQLKIQAEQLKAQTEQAKARVEMDRIQREADIDRQLKLLEFELKKHEHTMKMEEMRSKHEVGMAAGKLKMAQMKERPHEPVGRK